MGEKGKKQEESWGITCEGKPHIAVLGYFMDLPSRPDVSGDDLVEVIQNRSFIGQDYLKTGNLHPWEYAEDGNPWMFQHKYGHKYRDQRFGGDLTLLQITEKESKFISVIQLIALRSVWGGLENSGVPISLLHKTKTGVFVAAYEMFGGFQSYPDETSLRGGIMSGISDRIAYFLGTHGPTVTLETACSSSLVAMTLAVDSIRNGSCDVAVLVSVNIMSTEYEVALQATGVVSKKGECRPFDEDSSGTLRCEGCGCMILCSMDWARKHGYSETIKTMIINSTIGSAGADPNAHQGSGRVYESPNTRGMAEMIRLCHEQAGLPLEAIQYVEAHATGTRVGDLIELQALTEVYKDSHNIQKNPLRVGSIKGNIGHAELAAGMFSMIKVIEMFRKRRFFPTGGYNISPRKDFDWDGSNIKLCLDDEPFPSDQPVYVGVNSFGVGGSYAHAIVSEYRAQDTTNVANEEGPNLSELRPLLFSISAASTRHLVLYEKNLLGYLQDNPGDISLLEACGLFTINRSHLSFRRHYLAHSMDDLMAQLADESKNSAIEGTEHNRTVAMVFTGQGSQWISMGSQLMVFKAYRDTVSRFDALYGKLADWSSLDMLKSLQDDRLADTMYAQPLTFMVQIGLIELLKYLGVVPNVVIGHSAGEIAALYCSGLLSLEDSATVIHHRSHCQQALAGNGRMLAVQMSNVDARKMLKQHSTIVRSCQIACVNSPSSVVIAGPESELEILRKHLASKQVRSTLLKGNTAFHSFLMESILIDVDRRLKFLNKTKFRKAKIPFLSTVTGLPQSTLSSEYIVHNIRQPVRFLETVQYLLSHFSPDVIVEIGPHKTLAPLLVECIQASDHQAKVLSSLSKGQNDVQVFWQLIVELMNHDIRVDLSRLYRDLGYRFSQIASKRIPGHPFIDQQIDGWLFPKRTSLLGKRDIGPACGTLESQNTNLVTTVEISRATSSSMAEHVMGGQALLPGMYFVEAAIEASGVQHQDCLSISDVEFHEMCPIPDRARNEDPRTLFVRQSAEETNSLTKFSVESRPLHGSDIIVHCTGSMISFTCPDILDGSQYLPGRKGFKEKRKDTRDIGQEGIKNLLESHHSMYRMGRIYDVINEAGVTEYGPSFQVIDELRTSPNGLSIVATIKFDHAQWSNKGGAYAVQLLDGILQLAYLNPNIPSGHVSYAGGFDLGIFARRPSSNPCIVHLKFLEDGGRYGKTVITGDALMYDPNGLLLCHLIGIKSIMGKRMTRTFDAIQVWQPISMPCTRKYFSSSCSEIEKPGSDDCRSVARIIFDRLREKKTLVRGTAVHLRILEYWDNSTSLPVVFENMAYADNESLPEDVNYLVEIFIATHNEDVLRKAFLISQKHKRWLRVRLVFLPSGQEALDNLCFDIVATWKKGGSGEEHWEHPLEFVETAGKLGCQGCLLLHDLEMDHTWDGFVENSCEHACGVSSCMVLNKALLRVQSQAKTIFLVSNDPDALSRLHEAIACLTSDFAAKVVVKSRCLDHRDQHGISSLVEEFNNEFGERKLVFLHGILDDSKYAQDTFVLVSRIANFLGAKKDAKAHLWVITCNAFVPPINVHRGSLLPLVIGINTTFSNISANFVDVPSRHDTFELLPVLILSNLGPHQFLIDTEGILHQRIMLPIEIECPPNRLNVSSNDPEKYYKCELVTSDQNGIGGYDFFAHKVSSPGSCEVLVDIKYVSLNFRDIMLTLNALPRTSFEASYYGYNLGMEASGVVIEVGDGVENVAIGDHVAVSGKGTIASKLIVPAESVVKWKGSDITLKDAAGLASVYCTAYHALIELCNLKKGERVLIHAAAGGVGHAAMSICSYVGAEVYATSSQSKQGYCMDMLGIPKSRLFDSRTVSWFDDLMQATNDEGVDVVINSLAGEHQRLGVQCLRPGGRFCEIGKADIFNNERLYLFAFRKNIRLCAIDMDRIALESSEKLSELTRKVFDGVARGDFKCLPTTCFPMDKTKDAIEYMKSGAHIGKVILTNYSEDQPLTISTRNIVRFDREMFHLILGGAGGFGSKMIRWLHKHGARKFVTTVSKDPSRVAIMFKDLMEDGTVIEVIEANLSNESDLEKIEQFVTCEPVHGHVETMIHCAGIYEAFYFEDVPDDVLERQGDIKVQSALFLDKLSRKLHRSVKNFMIVGSNSSEFTPPFLATYSATNAMLGSIARKREYEGLPVTILHMGSLKDVGIVAKDEATLAYQKKTGYELLNSPRAIMAFEKMLSDQTTSMLHAFYYPQSLAKNLGSVWIGAHTTPVMDSRLMFGEQSNKASDGVHASYNLTLERVIWLLMDSLNIDQEHVTASTTLSSLGVDSLAILEFRQHIQDEFGYSIDRSAFAMTVGDLSRDIFNKLKQDVVKKIEEKRENPEKSINQPVADADEVPIHDSQKYLKHFYTVENPKGYAIIFPGADQKGLYFADWKLDHIQALVVDLHGAHLDHTATAQAVALELDADGYLEDKDAKVIFLGYSIGCFSALETCKELIDVYSFHPAGLIPICYAAPQACRNYLHLLPKVVRRAIMKKSFHHQLIREYGVPDPDDIILYSVYLQRPSFKTIFMWEEEAQVYFNKVCRHLKRCKGHYIGKTPIHYIYAVKDQIGNPKRISDPMKHGWRELTSGPFETCAWYGLHSSLVDPIVGTLFRELVLDTIQNLVN